MGGGDGAGHGAGDLHRPVQRQVEHALGRSDGHAQRGLLEADARQHHLVGDGGLPDARWSDDHQALARRPRRLLTGAPEWLLLRPGLGDEVPAVDDVPRQPTGAVGEGALTLGAEFCCDGGADHVRISPGGQGALDRSDARAVQGPQFGGSSHDPGVVLGVGSRGRRCSYQGVQVVLAADPRQVVLAAEVVAECDGVGGRSGCPESQDGPPDGLVRRPVEVLGFQDASDCLHCAVVDHACAQDGLLRALVMGWLADGKPVDLGPTSAVRRLGVGDRRLMHSDVLTRSFWVATRLLRRRLFQGWAVLGFRFSPRCSCTGGFAHWGTRWLALHPSF